MSSLIFKTIPDKEQVNSKESSNEMKQASPDNKWTCVCSDKAQVVINLKQFCNHSGYFKALFRSQVEEHEKKQVHLELVSARLLSQIQTLLDTLDSGQFEMELDLQVFDVMSQWTDRHEMDTLLTAIDYLDMHSLRKLCDRYFCSLHEVNTDNLDYLLQLSSRFTFGELEKKILSFLLRNTWNLTNVDIEILPFNLLKGLLRSNKANVFSEWDLVEILDTWCVRKCRENAREVSDQKVTELAQCIRLPQLLKDTKCNQRVEEIKYVILKNKIKTAIFDFEIDSETYFENYSTDSGQRRGESLLLAMRLPFGNRLDRACSFSKDFSIDNNEDIVFSESRTLSASIPCDSLREFCVCSVGQYIYVAGGQRKYSLAGQFAVQHVYRLNLEQLEWNTVSPLTTSRCLFHMDSVGGYLYAVGGINASGELSSVEKYNTVNDQWSVVQSLDYRIHEHAGCVQSKQLYISGGHDGSSHVDTLSRYDVTTNTWYRCAPMLMPRSCHTMTCLNNRLYVIGGSKIRKCKVYGMQTIECYSIQSDQWSQVQVQFPSVYTACLSVYRRPRSSHLLVLGGYSYKSDKYTLEMHSFCERTCAWSPVPVRFNSNRKDKTDVAIIEVKVSKHVADQLIRERRSCTLK